MDVHILVNRLQNCFYHGYLLYIR